MEGRIKKSQDYWYNVITGGILTFLIIFLCGILISLKLDISFLNIYYLLFCLLVVIFYQWKDDNIKIFQTKLPKKANFELTEKALDKLNWEYVSTSAEIKLTYNIYMLKFLNITITPKSEKICFNFQYHSTSKTGRFPFYFGISTLMEWKFKRSLKNELQNIRSNI
ncbi:MAG: hypothetical protein H6553_02080 [Chitinophagales bacterium]|nr:hypothetical protein [Chitinophagales bacterium]